MSTFVGPRRFRKEPGRYRFLLPPVLTVMLASMAPILPLVASVPLLPPLGFLTLMAWRLLRAELWPVWVPLPLGLFDDLFSGQPLGSAMALWTMALLIVDMLDRQFVWRDHWQDWSIAAALTAALLMGQLLVVQWTGGGAPGWALVPQWLVSALCFPALVRLCTRVDHWRLGW